MNTRIRRVGVGASVLLTYPPGTSSVARIGSVIDRDVTPDWFDRALRDQESSLLLDTMGTGQGLLVGYGPWHSRSVPILYRDGDEEVPVWGFKVVELGIQVDADRSAAAIYDEVARYGGP